MKSLVSIIILNWNGLLDTLECLESLKRVTYPNYQVVVVDNGSRNDEGQVIKQKFPKIHLIQNKKNEGFAEGNNIGIRYAVGYRPEYFLLLNNDTVVSPGFLDTLVDYTKAHPEVGIVGPKILYYESDTIWFNGARLYSWLGLFRHLEFGTKNSESKIKEPQTVDYISGAAFLIKRKVIEEIGLFYAPFFAYYEETDWCFRAKKAGYKSVVIPQSVIWHKVAASAGDKGKNNLNAFQAYFYARNARLFAKRNLKGLQRIIFLFGHFTFSLGYNLLRCKNNQARLAYFKGLKERI